MGDDGVPNGMFYCGEDEIKRFFQPILLRNLTTAAQNVTFVEYGRYVQEAELFFGFAHRMRDLLQFEDDIMDEATLQDSLETVGYTLHATWDEVKDSERLKPYSAWVEDTDYVDLNLHREENDMRLHVDGVEDDDWSAFLAELDVVGDVVVHVDNVVRSSFVPTSATFPLSRT